MREEINSVPNHKFTYVECTVLLEYILSPAR